MAKKNPKLLLVEGNTDKRVIPELMEKNGVNPWEISPKKYVVDIEVLKSKTSEDESKVNKSFNTEETITKITTELKASNRSALGWIMDRDFTDQNTWESVRNICTKAIKKYYDDQYPETDIPEIPKYLPDQGLIITLEGNIKFGVWMMPDNKNEGMLETFLTYLIPDPESNPLWLYTKEVVAEAKQQGASYIDNHRDKALIHTWLAWQNEPGRQLHLAVKCKNLDPTHPRGQAFVKWFKELYSL
ncbi:MAG: DUF3226 domain-containing protein [Microcystaceae cyanobacterium]